MESFVIIFDWKKGVSAPWLICAVYRDYGITEIVLCFTFLSGIF